VSTVNRISCLVVIALAAFPAWVAADIIEQESSLVGYWKLDDAVGAATVIDVKSGYNGAVIGGVTLGQRSATSLLGTAARFNRSVSGMIDVSYQAALNPTQFTVEAWSQTVGDVSAHGSPVTSRGGSPFGSYIFYAVPGTTPVWSFWTCDQNSAWHMTNGPAVVDGQWVHLAGTQDATTKVFYMNGNPVATATTGFTRNTASPLRFGAGRTDGTPDYFLNGSVDNVAVFNQALAHQKISDHYNAFSPYANAVRTDRPLAFWRLGEQAGQTAYNAKDVASYKGVYQESTGNPTFTNIGVTRSVGSAATACTDADTSVGFDGVNDVVRVPYSADLNPAGSFSVEIWAKVEGGQGTYRSPLTSRTSAGGSEGYLLYASADNKWQFWTGNGNSTGPWHMLSGPTVQLDMWTHLVGTFLWDGSAADANGALNGTKSLYLDGTLVASGAGKYKPLRTSPSPLTIGAGGDVGTNYFFNGKLDEAAVYDYALSLDQIRAHYAAAVPEPSSLVMLLLGGIGIAAWRRRSPDN
jgi:hypothetical protein